MAPSVPIQKSLNSVLDIIDSHSACVISCLETMRSCGLAMPSPWSFRVQDRAGHDIAMVVFGLTGEGIPEIMFQRITIEFAK